MYLLLDYYHMNVVYSTDCISLNAHVSRDNTICYQLNHSESQLHETMDLEQEETALTFA